MTNGDVLVEKSVTMAQVPWPTMPEFHRPVYAKLITWGFILFYSYNCLGALEGDNFDGKLAYQLNSAAVKLKIAMYT